MSRTIYNTGLWLSKAKILGWWPDLLRLQGLMRTRVKVQQGGLAQGSHHRRGHGHHVSVFTETPNVPHRLFCDFSKQILDRPNITFCLFWVIYPQSIGGNLKLQSNLNRKTLISGYLTASLAFRPRITHHTPSVFDADQRGIGQFFLTGLGHQENRQ